MNTHASVFLRRSLVLDGVISGATGLLMLLGAGPLEQLLGVPAALMRPAGIVLLPFAAMVLYFASRENLTRATVWTVIGLNLAWAAMSALALVGGWITPTGLGVAFVVCQAVVVAGFAELQYTGLRRAAIAG